MKYRVDCITPSGDSFLFQYETDAEPPRVGDLLDLSVISKNQINNTYEVKEVIYQPLNKRTTKVIVDLKTRATLKSKGRITPTRKMAK